MPKTFDDAGELILGTRLKKLGDKFLDDVSTIYKKIGVDFEPSWFAIFFTLDKYGKLTMTEVASDLGVTQSAISQIVSTLEKKKLVKIEATNGDKRIKIVSLTENAVNLLSKVKPVWKVIKYKMKEMLDEGENSKNMLDALKEFECSFLKKSLSKRVLEIIEEKNYKVEQYKHKYFFKLKRLIFLWVFDYGVPKIGFINNLEEILDNSETYIAFRDKNIMAAVIILKNEKYREIFLINKNDFNDKADAVLIQNIFSSMKSEKKKAKIYLDSDNFDVKSLLKKNGYVYKKTTNFSENSKRLDIFEGTL